MKKILWAIAVIVLASLACNTGQQREISLYPSATPTEAKQVETVVPTQTPDVRIVEITSTPVPVISTTIKLCVTATEAVYLRPSPSATYYPLKPLPNGTEVIYKGTHNESWLFVEFGEDAGWIHSDYLKECGG